MDRTEGRAHGVLLCRSNRFLREGLYHEQFTDSRSCWIDVRSRTRSRAKRWDTEGLPTRSHPGLCETFDDVSGPCFWPCYSTKRCRAILYFADAKLLIILRCASVCAYFTGGRVSSQRSINLRNCSRLLESDGDQPSNRCTGTVFLDRSDHACSPSHIQRSAWRLGLDTEHSGCAGPQWGPWSRCAARSHHSVHEHACDHVYAERHLIQGAGRKKSRAGDGSGGGKFLHGLFATCRRPVPSRHEPDLNDHDRGGCQNWRAMSERRRSRGR